MTVKEFIEWLQAQDQEATVEVLAGMRSRDYSPDLYRFEEFIPERYSYYTDMRENQFAKGKPYENKRTLQLGEYA